MTAPRPAADIANPSAAPSRVIYEAELIQFLARHDQHERLCDRLEACADTLPAWPSQETARYLREALSSFIEREVAGDSPLAGAFRRGPNHDPHQDPLAAALIRHVDSRRTDDLIHAQDLIAALGARPGANDRIAAETLGYMLRCFFAARRQAIAFEALAVLTLAGDDLAAKGRCQLVAGLSRTA